MQTNRVVSGISTFIVCFLFWMLLVWSVAPREIVLGVIVAAIMAWFAGRFFIHSSPFYLFNPVRLVTMIVYCVIIFLWEIIKANLSMAAIVLSPNLKDYKAGIIRVPGSDEIKSEYGLAMVSNCITLTPGTITLHIEGDALTVHCLNRQDADGLEHSSMETKIAKLEESK